MRNTPIFLFILSLVGCGMNQPPSKTNSIRALDTMGERRTLDNSDDYRLGSEWGKHPVTDAELADAIYGRAIKATAKLTSATSFYLGKFNGKHVLATNHHVCESARSCVGAAARFDALQVRATVKEFYGSWPSIDLALMTIDVAADDEAALATVAGNFDFAAHPDKGTPLVTVGYGVAKNPFQKLVINHDDDCKTFSDKNDFHLMADPDEVNPSDYKAWSFAFGCDVSHGDSGSAIVDRQTGHVIGLLWTGRVPKGAQVQDTAYLDQLLTGGGDDVWKELSYAVPAAKIGETLKALVESGDGLDADGKATLTAVLGL